MTFVSIGWKRMLKAVLLLVGISALNGCAGLGQPSEKIDFKNELNVCQNHIQVFKNMDQTKYQKYSGEFTHLVESLRKYVAVQNSTDNEIQKMMSPLYVQKIRQFCFEVKVDVANSLRTNAMQ